ncbi:L-aspartate--glyoxylate aminotransferase BhcA [Methylobacterium brachythecii]|uniref:Serine--glyoxylate aminotransferase n=1 Tax=Methylobacterium brachythecii TaxID=1176177 RepID=A0A7W6AL41_9HYPH|nr:L-aspartate--glyoxylate aminotransferase BhcA [Methylobacterium brachythecii]MBB3903210.1 alanine-glyoxylate transaminase/serine-glyoxylate transaminase/serine-pyruvate transaminase [Methylobacterium brachythecii]GLS45989.1 serine--glyoxylate aminotransferase [Methylobacterium brachythecii]
MSTQNPIFIPGPTNIPDVLRKAVDMPTIDHRSPLFAEILRPALASVRKVLKSADAEIFVFPSTGTGGWETAITNVLSPGDAVLATLHGRFSERWIDMCRHHGLDMQVVTQAWGDGIPADRLEEILAADKHHRIKAVLGTHNETATGVRSDISAVRRALHATRHPALLFVDGVSSVGCMDFRMDEWGVDVAVTGSQKGFMLPPGLAIVGFSRHAIAAAEHAKLARNFFDIRAMRESYAGGGYPYTPPVGLLNGLRVAGDMLLAEGLDNVFARHFRIAEGVRRAVAAWGLRLCAARPELYSDTVSAIRVPDGFDANAVVSHALNAYGVSFGTGLGEVAGKVFRIGHLGSLTEVMALSGIATAEMVLADLGIPIRLGSGVAAAQEHYRQSTSVALKRAA